MSGLEGDEAPLSEPFWLFETASESRVVGAVLRRRFPETYAILAESLEKADPLDVVYPDNPDEYSDVVREILVLLAPVNADLSRITAERTEEVVREGLARRFGELPDDERVRMAVRLISERAAG